MGHGTAIKKFPSDAELENEKYLRLFRAVKSANYFITTSERQNELEFRNPILDKDSKNVYLPLGLPKNDYYFNLYKVNKVNLEARETLGVLPSDYLILYAPTFRDYSLKESPISKEVLIKINQLLSGNNAYMLYRPHKLGGTINEDLVNRLNLDRILLTKRYQLDTFSSLCVSNALITDYSSIGIEFLPLNRPIISFVFDEEEYKEKRGIEIDFNDESLSPGLVVRDSDQLIKSLSLLFKQEYDNDYWVNRRNECLNNHYTFPDGKASERIWKLILEFLEK
ncbi:CDP-glycerol glycerophosphotransferase family protein [Fictibacillus arsenicus]|uniref:CDP-glycerol--glycerophosphate glycerophosphotransferase n=1 Tax=Fictibacillus arsenicus TaxID=255247 RepID=A0A1V3GC79_9BACL|nr:CDP-glycerol glycerophosphotransferase family protein [Fictibacillus arsenicus]OOE14445.1 hypothetical protein UN64_04425 [Fictibacillus arsenicus]